MRAGRAHTQGCILHADLLEHAVRQRCAAKWQHWHTAADVQLAVCMQVASGWTMTAELTWLPSTSFGCPMSPAQSLAGLQR